MLLSLPWMRKWQPTLIFLPGNPMDRGTQQASLWGHKIITERLTLWLLNSEQVLERKKK